MKTDLIIFDLDGTLIDSCEDIMHALNYCFEERGIERFNYDEVRQMVGEGINNLIEKALIKRNVSFSLDEMVKCFLRYYKDHITDYSKLYPEVKETLEALNNIKKAVISNKLTELSLKTMENLSILKYFDFVAGSDTFKEKKPSPLPVIETMTRLKVLPERTIMVGDSDIDIKSGKMAGTKTVAVTYGYRDRKILKDADFIIDRFGELLKIIEG